jgi:hypothetical protein
MVLDEEIFERFTRTALDIVWVRKLLCEVCPEDGVLSCGIAIKDGFQTIYHFLSECGAECKGAVASRKLLRDEADHPNVLSRVRVGNEVIAGSAHINRGKTRVFNESDKAPNIMVPKNLKKFLDFNA